MMSFQTAIFDLDGTLLNTLDDLTDSVNHVLEKYGYPLRKPREIRRFLGNGSKHLITRSLPENTDAETVEQVHTDYLAWYGPHSQIKTAPYGGIPELLTELKNRGATLAVVSNKGDGQVKPLVRKYFPQIDFAVGERPGIRRKPYPDSIFEAIKVLNADPKTTIFVGDSEVDMETAKNAGLPAIAVGWGFRDQEELMKYSPALFLENPLDLLK